MPIQVVSFKCVLKNSCGQVLSSTVNREVLTHSNSSFHKAALPALAEALVDLKRGEYRRICLRAEQAYGLYDLGLVVCRSLDEIDMNGPVTVGDVVTFVSGDHRGQFRVTELSAEHIALDGNHPYAGQDLVFEIEATEARDATLEEIEESMSTDGTQCEPNQRRKA